MSRKIRYKSKRLYTAAEVNKLNNSYQWAVNEYDRIMNFKRPNIVIENKKLHEIVRIMIEFSAVITDLKDHLNAQLKLLEEGGEDLTNSGLPWDDREDEFIVDRKSKGERIETIAKALGRSPFSVASRLSNLVGVSRDRNVDVMIEGLLEKDYVEGHFRGTITRTDKK
ncbi:MAG TPA: hypothetical protein VJ742_05570 [Nitrososphaera sp.]|nr:hypothetical protein [Nitrososphaera sp.]